MLCSFQRCAIVASTAALLMLAREASAHVVHNGVAAFVTTDVSGRIGPGWQHAAVATTTGAIYDVVTNLVGPLGSGERATKTMSLGDFPGVVSIAGFFTGDDGFDHVIVAQASGAVTEIDYTMTDGRARLVAHFPPTRFGRIVALSGHYSASSGDPAQSDGFRHVVIAFSSNVVEELSWGSSVKLRALPLPGASGDVVGITSYYTPHDSFNHVFVLTTTGAVSEIRYRAESREDDDLLGAIPIDAELLARAIAASLPARDPLYSTADLPWGYDAPLATGFTADSGRVLVALAADGAGWTSNLAAVYAGETKDTLIWSEPMTYPGDAGTRVLGSF